MEKESYHASNKRRACMSEVMKKLKGISCLLYALSYQGEESVFKWQEEALDLLSGSLEECVEELEENDIINEVLADS